MALTFIHQDLHLFNSQKMKMLKRLVKGKMELNLLDDELVSCYNNNLSLPVKAKFKIYFYFLEVRMFDKNKFNVNKNQAKKKNRNRNRSRSPLVRGPLGVPPQYGAVPPPAGPTGTRHGAPLPPSSYYDYYPDELLVGYGPPPPPPSPVNDAEIIVVNKEQW